MGKAIESMTFVMGISFPNLTESVGEFPLKVQLAVDMNPTSSYMLAVYLVFS